MQHTAVLKRMIEDFFTTQCVPKKYKMYMTSNTVIKFFRPNKMVR